MRYRIKDSSIPNGKTVKLTCKACNSPIVIDIKQSVEATGLANNDSLGTLRKRIIKSIKDLPLVPRVVLEIQNRLSQTNINMQEVCKVIETDPGITFKVLRVANSAYYGASGKTSTIMQACVKLGLRGISEVVILAGTEKALSGKLP
jgi:HD-like signal output (HDOD) protein